MGEDDLISHDTKIIHNPANSNVQSSSFVKSIFCLYM